MSKQMHKIMNEILTPDDLIIDGGRFAGSEPQLGLNDGGCAETAVGAGRSTEPQNGVSVRRKGDDPVANRQAAGRDADRC